MSKIRVLADHVANQIAAGEVVERPASVAKELVENSIDAGATRITIEIEAGGRRLLKVSDDGEGMVRDDAILAFERHATSKIRVADDLIAIGTLGFRGEALASIASVAKVELTTSTEGASAGTRVTIEGGRMRDVKDAAHPRGTTIAVRDLFFNVPARRKFLRSEATETFHLTNLVTHYALAHPEIAFTFINNGRDVVRAVAAKDLRERAYQIFGEEFLENLLPVDGGDAQVARVTRFRFRAARPAHLARLAVFVREPALRARSNDWPLAVGGLPIDPAARRLSGGAVIHRNAAVKKLTLTFIRRKPKCASVARPPSQTQCAKPSATPSPAANTYHRLHRHQTDTTDTDCQRRGFIYSSATAYRVRAFTFW